MSLERSSKNKRVTPHGNFWYDFVKITGAIPALIMFRPKVYHPFGRQSLSGGLLMCANHRSFWDPVILLTAFPQRRLHSLCTKDLYKNKFMCAFLPRMHCIKVDKGNFTTTAFRDVTDRLSAGHAVVIFPEGEVNANGAQDNSLLAFKSGAVLMAHRSGTRLLPVYIAKRDKWYQRQRIAVGRPIDVRELLGPMPTLAAMGEVTALLQEREAELREFAERGFRLPSDADVPKNDNSQDTDTCVNV